MGPVLLGDVAFAEFNMLKQMLQLLLGNERDDW